MFSILEGSQRKQDREATKKINHRQNSELLYNTGIYIEGTLKVQKQ